jgi:hypothetical protein
MEDDDGVITDWSSRGSSWLWKNRFFFFFFFFLSLDFFLLLLLLAAYLNYTYKRVGPIFFF